MRITIKVLLVAVVLGSSASCQTEREIRESLIGKWKIAPCEEEYNPFNTWLPNEIEFREDGTFLGGSCQENYDSLQNHCTCRWYYIDEKLSIFMDESFLMYPANLYPEVQNRFAMADGFGIENISDDFIQFSPPSSSFSIMCFER